MTGCGHVEVAAEDGDVTVSVKALNGKFLDLSLRLPKEIEERDLAVRHMVSKVIERGKVSVYVQCQDPPPSSAPLPEINKESLLGHYRALRHIAKAEGINISEERAMEWAISLPGLGSRQGKGVCKGLMVVC